MIYLKTSRPGAISLIQHMHIHDMHLLKPEKMIKMYLISSEPCSLRRKHIQWQILTENKHKIHFKYGGAANT